MTREQFEEQFPYLDRIYVKPYDIDAAMSMLAEILFYDKLNKNQRRNLVAISLIKQKFMQKKTKFLHLSKNKRIQKIQDIETRIIEAEDDEKFNERQRNLRQCKLQLYLTYFKHQVGPMSSYKFLNFNTSLDDFRRLMVKPKRNFIMIDQDPENMEAQDLITEKELTEILNILT